MPNVSPKGVFGRHLGVWKPPAAIFARQAGAWKKVNFVYAMRNGVWQLIYASDPVAPASATAAWVNPHSVRVTITPPAVNSNSSWIVRRSDGSIVDTVPVGTLTVTDPTPILTSNVLGNKTLAAYTVEGTDGATSSARVSTNTVTWNLDAATVTTAVTYPTATTATATVSWTPNATYGSPDGWKVYRVDNAQWLPVGDPLPGSTLSYAVTSLARGVAYSFRAIPMAKLDDGSWVQAGNGNNTAANSKATTPVSLSLTAPTSPVQTLRLTWASGGGTVTAYEVETSPNGTTWTASADDTSPSDWTTSVAGYMRVRATSPGGVSDWSQAGPKTPILDVTPPPAANITSWKPEASYGRMVVRGNYANNADVSFGEIYYKVGSGSYVKVWGKTAVAAGQAISLAVGTFDAGDVVTVLVRTWDDYGNFADDTAVYTLTASPAIFDPTDSATWRTDEWRTDAVAGSTGVMHGRTSSGENKGCWFYGTAVNAFFKTHDVVSATVEYNRDGSSQGSGSAIQPQIWVHQHAAQPTGAPLMGAGSTVVLGSGVARSGTTGGSASLSSSLIDALGGAYYGIGVYRSTSVTDDSNAASYYMRLYPFKTNSGGKISGRLTANHLG